MVSLEFFIEIILPAAQWIWGSTPLITDTSTRIICGGKGGQVVGLTTLPPSCADCLEIWEPRPPGTLSARPGIAFLQSLSPRHSSSVLYFSILSSLFLFSSLSQLSYFFLCYPSVFPSSLVCAKML